MTKDTIVKEILNIITSTVVDNQAQRIDMILYPLFNKNEKLYWNVIEELIKKAEQVNTLVKCGALNPENN